MTVTREIGKSIAICAALSFAGNACAVDTRGKLEYFDFKDLQIVSVQIISGKWRACVYTPKGEAVIVTDGDGIGRAKGVITGLQKDGLQVREMVLSGYDSVEKRSFLQTAESIDAKAAKACKLKIDAFPKTRPKR